MKPRVVKTRSRAFTVVEVVVVVVVLLFVFAVLLLPPLARIRSEQNPIICVSNLKQIYLTTLVWKQDNNSSLYPMQISVTNGGAMELIATDNVAGFFEMMSNELSTAMILRCPFDRQVIKSINGLGPGFCNKNISYFVGLDADTNYPKRLMFGDDNFEINGSPIASGIAQISTNASMGWTKARHKYAGNIGLADGSVLEVSDLGLQQALIQTGLATNRLAIP